MVGRLSLAGRHASHVHELEVGPTVTMANELITCTGALVGAVGGSYAMLATERARHLPLVVRILMPLFGIILGVGVAIRVTPSLLAAASLILLAVALPLSVIDATTRKLPDRLLLPAIPACVTLLALAASHAGHYGPLWRALVASAVVFLAFTTLALAVPGQLGFGDCKAAALCTLPLGYLGWNYVLLGILAAYLFAAFFLVGRRLAGAAAAATIPFGPFLFAGPLVALLLS